jgi:signal transduction histidine kinase
MVLLVTVLVFAGFTTNVVQHVATEGDPARLALALALCGGIVALHIGVLGNPAIPSSSLQARLAAAALVLLCALGLAIFGDPWDSMTAVATAAVFVVAPWMFGVLSIVATAGVIAWLSPESPWMFSYVLTFQTLFGVGFFVLARLRGVVMELDATRDALANVATQHERLRLAQDLHDLLGLTLSAITLKAELAKRLITMQPERARRELGELRDIARRSKGDLTAIPTGTAQPELDEELRSAAAVLADGQIELRIVGSPGPLSLASANALALVIREAIANVLRHSAATSATLRWRHDSSTVTLDVLNDGVSGTRDRLGGQGHRNLAARVCALGGSMETAQRDGTFRLTTTLPVRAARRGWWSAVDSRSGLIAAAVFAAEVMNLVRIIVDRPQPAWALVLSTIAAVIATGLLALELVIPRRTAARRFAVFTVIAVLVFAPMLLLADPFVGPAGVVAAAALFLLPRRVGIPAFVAIAIAMPVMHVVLGSDPFYVIWSVEVVIDHGLVLFAILQLSRTVAELRETRARLEEAAVDDTRLGFERDLDAALRPGLERIERQADEAAEHMGDRERSAAAIEELIAGARDLLAEVRWVAAKYRPDEEEAVASTGLKA